MFGNKRNDRLPTKLLDNEYREQSKQRGEPVGQQKQTQEELEKTRICAKVILTMKKLLAQSLRDKNVKRDEASFIVNEGIQ